jgi:DNA polymerase elongation subunit (family B)
VNDLIYGKKGIQKIVSVEPRDNVLEVFYEKTPGNITSEFFPHKYWLLSSQKISENFQRLKGDLFYKYGKLFNTREDFLKARSIYRHKEIFSVYNAKESVAIKDGYSCFLDMTPNDVSLVSFDLKTTGLDPHLPDAQIVLISATFRAGRNLEKKLFCYNDYSSQGEMIDAFCTFIREKNPSLLIGHNVLGFDFNYLNVIASLSNTSLLLGRDGSSAVFDDYERKFRVDGNRDLGYHDVRIYGREIIDTMFLSIKADIGRKYDSYGLKPIIKQEGWELPNRVFYDSSLIRTNYTKPGEWAKIQQYCIDDSLDAITLFDKFCPPFFYMCQNVAKGSFQNVVNSASGSQLNSIMLRAYLQQAHSLPKADEPYYFEGAISIGNPGIYHNFMKLDVASLYPSIMMEYRIAPEHKDPKGYFTQLVGYLREERLKNKQLAKETENPYYSHLEQSQKIAINSLYGFMGAKGLLFNHIPGAASVTKYGRELLTQGMDIVKNKGMVIANVDTDSILFGYSSFAEIRPETRESIRTEFNEQFPDTISWEDDGYFPNVIIAKAKNYVLQDEKGKIKYKGSSLKSPTLEPALREFITRIISAILEKKNNFSEIYLEYVREINNITDIKRWAARKTISSKTLASERTNESKIRDAIEDTEYSEGDRIYCYFAPDESLRLIENFDGFYHKEKFYKKLFQAGQRFSTVLDCKNLFKNYSLKRNQKELEEILNEANLLEECKITGT